MLELLNDHLDLETCQNLVHATIDSEGLLLDLSQLHHFQDWHKRRLAMWSFLLAYYQKASNFRLPSASVKPNVDTERYMKAFCKALPSDLCPIIPLLSHHPHDVDNSKIDTNSTLKHVSFVKKFQPSTKYNDKLTLVETIRPDTLKQLASTLFAPAREIWTDGVHINLNEIKEFVEDHILNLKLDDLSNARICIAYLQTTIRSDDMLYKSQTWNEINVVSLMKIIGTLLNHSSQNSDDTFLSFIGNWCTATSQIGLAFVMANTIKTFVQRDIAKYSASLFLG